MVSDSTEKLCTLLPNLWKFFLITLENIQSGYNSYTHLDLPYNSISSHSLYEIKEKYIWNMIYFSLLFVIEKIIVIFCDFRSSILFV